MNIEEELQKFKEEVFKEEDPDIEYFKKKAVVNLE